MHALAYHFDLYRGVLPLQGGVDGMAALVSAFGSAARTAARALESAGIALEVAPYIEHCKWSIP